MSGRDVAAALREEGFEVFEVDAGPDLCSVLTDLTPDAVFNALHGRWGEDGCVQGLLEWMGIPYTHSGVRASAQAMDKRASKAIFRANGLPVVRDVPVTKAEAMARHPMEPPYVLKPVTEGSSVGVYIVPEGANGTAQIAPSTPDKLMAEAFIPGRELTVTVLDTSGQPVALGVTDIVVNAGWYDFDAKYVAGGSTHILPADLPEDITRLCLSHAVAAHKALGCRGMSRTDFRWDEARGTEGLNLLETNTQPGMTPTSLSPEQAAHVGISYGALCRMLVEDATCNR
ncbi:D-alanine-D-alanine ligase [Rubricella aquisinus]|uniref:D-alanine--D-alanine ligase n=1 Tax=Rubricella aquisinus TaxID=2028108 RepID=A0A840WPS0_9RHOB|nr:D-alanine-D-alanine ligase [Rubricella aquisinus]